MLSFLQTYCMLKASTMGENQEISCSKKILLVEDILSAYHLNYEKAVEIQKLLLNNMEKGLNKATNAVAKVKMFPTYVRNLPNGTESGDYLALDLGGTNFRVLLITLGGKERVKMVNKIFPLAHEIMIGPGTKLFDHIAACIAEFMTDHGLRSKKLPLGFTFSFPCRQEGLAVGRLVRWTKGFKCEGVEGENVVQLLHEAIARRKDMDVHCVAVINDTVGCLMSCAFEDHKCEIGVILGTGTNACYMEKLDEVQLWDGDNSEPQQMIVNTEWGAFGEDGELDFVRTDIDRELDSISLNPGKQIYEKLISGMYLGEIARRLILICTEKGLLFNGTVTEELRTADRFYTKYLSEVEKDGEKDHHRHTRQVLNEIGIVECIDEDCMAVHKICSTVCMRAAHLASVGIATLLNRINKPRVTVAVDGSLYRYYPRFDAMMKEKIQQLLKPGLEFDLMLSDDGSGKGAALVAAVAWSARVDNCSHD